MAGSREIRRDLSAVRFRVMNGRVTHPGSEVFTAHVLRAQDSHSAAGGFAYQHTGTELARCLVWVVGDLIRERGPVMI